MNELSDPSVKATDPSVVHVRVEMDRAAVDPVGTCTLERGGGRRQAPVAQPEHMWSRSPMTLDEPEAF
eukprot:CAMPEP_0174746414 /NCGR_PEP_ID=MMETSP1094-20130205/89008_1 /TAXON_ID=156173 /ORGANISM="Chrysochromulina brevifilum, Strain UTEX LB 985" /LENGTH=67 /DNA_ID=CAMNT_0015951115 /DNA_START=415 /DNA_END=615 /DNA_ORIENTATION=+